jgi:hypothetical protein
MNISPKDGAGDTARAIPGDFAFERRARYLAAKVVLFAVRRVPRGCTLTVACFPRRMRCTPTSFLED